MSEGLDVVKYGERASFFLKGLAQKHEAEVVFYNSQKSVNNEFSFHKNVNN